MEVLAETIGSAFLPAVNALAGFGAGFAKLVSAAAGFNPVFTNVVVTLGLVLASAKALNLAFAAAKVGVINFAAGITGMRAQLAAATVGLTGMSRAIAAVGVASRLLGGPIGLVLTAVSIGASLFSEFGNKGVESAESVKSAFGDLSESLEDARERFVKLNAEQQKFELHKLKSEVADAEKEFTASVDEVEMESARMRKTFGIFDEADHALNGMMDRVVSAMRKARSGAEVDWNALLAEIEKTPGVTQAVKDDFAKLILKTADLDTNAHALGSRFGELSGQAVAASGALDGMAGAVDGVNRAMSAGDIAADKFIKNLRKQIEDAQAVTAEQKVLLKARRDAEENPNQKWTDEDIRSAIEEQKTLDALQKKTEAAGAAERRKTRRRKPISPNSATLRSN
jgi:hypothetical protein